MDAKRYAAASPLSGWRPGENGALILDLAGARAELSIGEDGAVRLRAASGDAPPPDPRPGIGRDPWKSAFVEPHATAEGGLRLAYEGAQGGAHLEIEPDPFRVRVLGHGGVEVATLEGLGFDAEGGARLELGIREGERFFGFGEKPGPLDKRGTALRMRNRDPEWETGRDPLYVSIPFFLGVAGGDARGLLLDALAPSRFDVGASRADRVGVTTDLGGLDVIVFPGPRPADVVRRFTARVGRTPLPPLWALGHHQSRWGYRSERQVRKIAEEIRRRRIPTDVIHLDIDYMDGFRVFTWHPKRFPDPKRLLSDLAEEGFRVVTIVDPGVKIDADYPVYREGEERGLFCKREDGATQVLRVWPGASALPDFNRPEVRDWWGEKHAALLDAGVAGIWNDMNEPAGWSRDVRLGRMMVPLRRQQLGHMRQADPADPSRDVSHESVRNVYGHQHCRATRSFLESAGRERRAFVLSRSGFAGTARYAAIWTGDNLSTWSSLRESIPMLLNLSLSGVAFCGADIGGFALACTPELYARWIQLGALYPFARTHSMWLSPAQEPWRFGRRVEAIAREALELRMRLLPYLYGLFREHEETGAPVWRPLFYEFPEDPESAATPDQLMLGPSLLVAPVVERGARERELHLPPGVWHAWHDDARFVGPRRLKVAAPLERLPLFARGGSLLPTRSPVRHVGETPEEPFRLEVFPGGDESALLVEDDGESKAYRGGVSARSPLRLWSRAGGRLRVEVGRREGPFRIAERAARIVVHGCPRPEQVTLDATRLPEGSELPGWRHEDGRVHVRFADTGAGATVEVDPAP